MATSEIGLLPMSAILTVTTPFFALVLCGYVAWQVRLLPESAIPGLNAFVLFFALPCLLFRYGAVTPIKQLLSPTVLGVYLVAAFALVFGTVAMTLSPRLSMKDAAFGAFVAAFPNTGFMGVPLLVALLGPGASGPAVSSLLVDFVITSALCLSLAQSQGSGGTTLARFGRAVRGAASNPLPWSIALGACTQASGLSLPASLTSVVKMLGDSATPVALFAMGGVLWRSRQHVNTRTAPGSYLPIAAIKLLVHPLLVHGLGLTARWLGAGLSDLELTTLTLVAALPSASNVSLLAERLGADNGRIAHAILASTVLAFVTFSFMAYGLR